MNRAIKVCLIACVFVQNIVFAQDEGDSISLVCHDTVWPTEMDVFKVVKIEVIGDYCSSDKLRDLSVFVNTETLVFNSYFGSDLHFNLDFPKLKELVFINCPNLDYDTVLSSIVSKYTVKRITISRGKLCDLPELICINFPKLEMLDLSYNNLEVVPNGLLKLENLRDLRLSNNNIVLIEVDWAKLGKLKRLDLSFNTELLKLERLSKVYLSRVGKSNIVHFGIADCGIQYFPKELSMSKIENLDLRYNKIGCLPERNDFKFLKIVNISGNKSLKFIPDSFINVVFPSTLPLD